ncbi:MAG: sulfotransferase, partial [Cytophagales bacterium]|nr:sulfotransferase [Cytophagales bacterium]
FNSKPMWFKAINSVWKSSYPLGTKIPLNKDRLIRLARTESGLQSFGPDFWEEPLERLITSVNEEAQLHPIGRFITQKRFVNLLTVRLRAEYWFKKHPEILEQEIYPITVICGLQRTGTTKLHRLLSADPDNRVLLSWEAINPAPLSAEPSEVEKRKAAARLSEKALKLMAPGFFSIHPVEFEKPEEDILLLDTTFLSTTAEATMHVPSYAQWLEKTDQTHAYQYLGKLLKLLQWQRPAKRWVLKTPHHMEFLDLIHQNFPKVQYVWTHRNIAESLPSFLSMVAHSRSIFSDNVSPEVVADHWVRKTAYMLSKGMDFRKSHPEVPFIDLFYKDLVNAPLAELAKIYGTPLSPELQQKFTATENENTIHRFGKHVYKLEDFNLTPASLNQTVQFYTDFAQSLKK